MENQPDIIPVKKFPEEFKMGVALGNIDQGCAHPLDKADSSHRHDYHLFFLIDTGEIEIEIDFEVFKATGPSFIYIHPDQAHRVVKNTAVSQFIGISSEFIHPEYHDSLNELAPLDPLEIEPGTLKLAKQLILVCQVLLDQSTDKYHFKMLHDSVNVFLGLTLSKYTQQKSTAESLPRYEEIAKEFRLLLNQHFLSLKRPSNYSDLMNLSTPYLNECVRNATGHPVSYHIQKRIVLEAKRLLVHSRKSAREIGFALGFEDTTYFSRYFKNQVGMTPLTFRRKYLDLSNHYS